MRRVTVILEDDTFKALERYIQCHYNNEIGQHRSVVIRRALKEWLEAQEEARDG